MARIKFNDAFDENFKKELQELSKELEGLLSTFKDLAKEAKTVQNAIKSASGFEQMNKAAKSAAENVDKLSDEEKELQRIVKATEKATVKYSTALSKENIELQKAKEQQRRATAEAKKLAKAQLNGVKSTNRWGKALGSFAFKFNALGNIAANVFSKITSGISGYIKDAAKMAAATEGVSRAFRAINDPGLLDKLREATRGTVSDLDLMTAAVKANNFQIPLKNLPKFFQFAAQRANETGESVDYLVESIVNGVARKSLPILDNLGLSATELREEMAKTGDMAEAVGNIIDRSMGDSGGQVLTMAEQYAQAAANAENLKAEVGKIINLFAAKMLPFLQKQVDLTREALMSQAMIQRQVLDASILYQIEQDRVEVIELANKLKQRGIELDKGQTYEQRAALLLLGQYRTLLASIDETEVKRIEQITAQIKALELMAGIAPKPKSILSEEEQKLIEERESAIKRMNKLLKEQSQIVDPDQSRVQAFLDKLNLEDLLLGAGEGIELGDDFWNEWFSSFESAGDDAVKVAEDVVQKVEQIEEAARQRKKAADQKAAQEYEQTIMSSISSVEGLVTEGLNIFLNSNQKKQDALEKRLNDGVISEKQYNEQINRLRREQDRIQKAQAIFSIGVNTAVAAMQVAGQTGVGAAIAVPLVLALGAAQIAAVLSEPMPQYELGTDAALGGPALVSEKGRELVKERSGKLWLTPDKPTIMDIPKGASVTPADVTHQMLKYATIATGLGPSAKDDTILRLMNEMEEIKHAIKSKPVMGNTITPAGIMTATQRGNTTQKKIKRYFM